MAVRARPRLGHDGLTVLDRVLNAVRAGVPSDRLPTALNIDPGLAEMAVDHWVRLGIVTPAGSLALGCAECPPISRRPATCKACPFG
jgi:hypothetical protein